MTNPEYLLAPSIFSIPIFRRKHQKCSFLWLYVPKQNQLNLKKNQKPKNFSRIPLKLMACRYQIHLYDPEILNICNPGICGLFRRNFSCKTCHSLTSPFMTMLFCNNFQSKTDIRLWLSLAGNFSTRSMVFSETDRNKNQFTLVQASNSITSLCLVAEVLGPPETFLTYCVLKLPLELPQLKFLQDWDTFFY